MRSSVQALLRRAAAVMRGAFAVLALPAIAVPALAQSAPDAPVGGPADAAPAIVGKRAPSGSPGADGGKNTAGDWTAKVKPKPARSPKPRSPADGATVSGDNAADAAAGPVPVSPLAATKPAASEPAPVLGARSPDTPPVAGAAASIAPAAAVHATRAELTSEATATSFHLDLSQGVTARVFTLANPYRVIVDLPDVGFQMPSSIGKRGLGLVSEFRFGLFLEGKARVVLDTKVPVRIDKAEMTAIAGSGAMRLSIAMVPTDAATFGAGSGAGLADPGNSPQSTGARKDPGDKPAAENPASAATAGESDASTEPPSARPKERNRPVVVIDAGHGGIDPGTIGSGNMLEKNLVLAVARHLHSTLSASGRYDLHMTRDRDVFVALDRRVQISRELGADLFISLHADSIETKSAAQNIKGATVYTLSERASDAQARRMAEKENASDLLAGIDSGEKVGKSEVRNILIDLLKRETADFSAAFSRALVGKLGGALSLAREPQRSAAFKVLKQTHSPSVLIELGYLSNADEERLMSTPEWQRKVAASIASAVDTYFSRHTARASTPVPLP